jgi:hypothetical protein
MSEKFDYKGFSKERLERLCSKKYIYRSHIKPIHGLSEIYSMGLNYRMFSNYSMCLPLCVYSDHGVGNDDVNSGNIKVVPKNVSVIFAFSAKRVKKLQQFFKVPCYKVTAPAIHYRRKHVKQEKSAQGTIVFPVHSTPNTFLDFNIDDYIKSLQELPGYMHPVCVCLYMQDVNNGMHIKFIEKGVPVYTAGHVYDERFMKRFYAILKNFKYSISNEMGSYAYYSCEMGIAFSLYGDKPKIINIDNPYELSGEIKCDSDHYNEGNRLFSSLNTVVSSEQQKHVSECLGLDSSLSAKEVRNVLYKAFIKKACSPKFIVKFIIHYIAYLKNCCFNLSRKKEIWP